MDNKKREWRMAYCQNCRASLKFEYLSGTGVKITLQQQDGQKHQKKCSRCNNMNFY